MILNEKKNKKNGGGREGDRVQRKRWKGEKGKNGRNEKNERGVDGVGFFFCSKDGVGFECLCMCVFLFLFFLFITKWNGAFHQTSLSLPLPATLTQRAPPVSVAKPRNLSSQFLALHSNHEASLTIVSRVLIFASRRTHRLGFIPFLVAPAHAIAIVSSKKSSKKERVYSGKNSNSPLSSHLLRLPVFGFQPRYVVLLPFPSIVGFPFLLIFLFFS